eukprot:scaffold2363_cov159-Pinguiococcus_pyrenoidosus.AAC.7
MPYLPKVEGHAYQIVKMLEMWLTFHREQREETKGNEQASSTGPRENGRNVNPLEADARFKLRKHFVESNLVRTLPERLHIRQSRRQLSRQLRPLCWEPLGPNVVRQKDRDLLQHGVDSELGRIILEFGLSRPSPFAPALQPPALDLRSLAHPDRGGGVAIHHRNQSFDAHVIGHVAAQAHALR